MKTFGRAQLAALVATLVDFGTLTLSVEIFKFFYPFGVALGALLGALTNFFMNRHWSFQAHDKPLKGQMVRYLVVSVGSLGLNTVGVYLITENFGVFYLYSKLMIAVLVGVFFNYPLHRNFVYLKDERKKERRSGVT